MNTKEKLPKNKSIIKINIFRPSMSGIGKNKRKI